AARFNTSEHRIFDQHVICLAGDGCMQEGVASEASAFAGHFGLDNLILIYDSNAVTLDAPAPATQSEDTAMRFKAYGFDVQEINDYFAAHKKELLAEYERWEKTFNDWRKKNPDLAKMLDHGIERKVPTDLLSKIPEFPKDAKLATRKAGSEALQPVAQAMPLLISGSADLHGSTLNYIKDGGDFTRETPSGRNIRFGIREHGMCAIMNGISYHGLFRA